MTAPYDPDTLGDLVRGAVDYLDRHDYDGAAAVLAPTMSRLRPHLLPARELIVEAAIAWARTAITPALAGNRLPWAEYAHHHAADVYSNPGHPRCLAAATALADLHDRRGDHREALPLRDTAVAGWCNLGDPTGVASARADRASTLHGLGRCGDAVREITEALTRWRPHHRRSPQLSETLIVTLIECLVLCGRDDEAAATIAGNADLLPAVGTRARHKLGLLTVALLDRDAKSGSHAAVCGHRDTHHLGALVPPATRGPWPPRRDRVLTLLTGTANEVTPGGDVHSPATNGHPAGVWASTNHQHFRGDGPPSSPANRGGHHDDHR